MSVEEGWDIISSSYQRRTSISLKDVHYGPMSAGESALKLLGNVKGKDVLEIGCGGGQNSIVLKKWGAQPTGIDLSQEQLRFARLLAKKERVRIPFYHGTMEDLSRFRDNSFDIVLSAFGVGYTDNLQKTFKEVYRVLRRNGVFVFADTHPMVSKGNIKRHGNRRALEISDYFSRRKHTWTWKIEDKSARFITHQRTIQDYFETLVREGFSVERLLEPEPYPLEEMTVKERQDKAPYLGNDECELRDFDIWKKIPFTIIFEAKKRAR
jgi:ubiquinone/menaquinone biosynthesis C-methylase UbiE